MPATTVRAEPGATHNDPALDDETRFRLVFEAGYGPLVSYARRRTGNPTVADDVVAETFATAWRRRADLQPGSSPLPWLYGIAGNVIRNQRRSQGRALRLVDRMRHDPLVATSAAEFERPDPELHAALDRLSFDDREVLRLIAWEELTHAEVAESLGCSVNAVGIRIHRARKRLRQELDSASPNPSPGLKPTATTTETKEQTHGQ